MADALRLVDLRGRLDQLEVACTRCKRRGRYRLERLIAEHGAELGLPDLGARLVLASGCPRAKAASLQDRCDVRFSQLIPSAE